MWKLKEVKDWLRIPLSETSQHELLHFFPKISIKSIKEMSGSLVKSFGDEWEWVFPQDRSCLGLSYIAWKETHLPLMMEPQSHRAPVFSAPLAKAMWGKKYHKDQKLNYIVDATGGLLKDALELRFLCDHLWIYERHPLLWPLIEVHLNHTLRNNFGGCKLEFFPEDFFSAKEIPPGPWALYFDPMFEAESKSLPSSSMQLLQLLMEGMKQSFGYFNDLEPSKAWDHIRSLPRLEKIVVKRWPKAPPYFTAPAATPTYQVTTKLLRLDIYQF